MRISFPAVCLRLLVVISAIFWQGCVDAYDPSLKLDADLVVVNGIITDLNETQTITLSRSRSTTDSGAISTPIRRAMVSVAVNGMPMSLLETQPGIYSFPAGFRGQVGTTYQLQFRTEDGVSYESSVETMVSVSSILKVYDQFNPEGPKKTADGKQIPANDIYIDFQDPANERNFYLWRWRLYEEQLYCATCQQGRYIVFDVGPVSSGPIDVLGCVRDTTLGSLNLFDYPCRSLCWDIFYNTTINAASDVYTNGQTQTGRKIASIPIYQRDPALIIVEQLSLSANAYRYYKLLADQVQNTGTLADSPPAPTAGNVKNVADVSENVIGYFSAASAAVGKHKIDRKMATTGIFQGLFFAINGRRPHLESEQAPNPAIGSGKSAVCVPSRNRTDLFPPGWND